MKELKEAFQGKRILVTGHTGFKGSWLCIWLHRMGAQVIGYALDPHTGRDNFMVSGLSEKIIDIRGDIRDLKKLGEVFDEYQPEVVFHLAAQPIVLESYQKPAETFEINLMGTLNVMEKIRKLPVCTALIITTDKCYENKEQLWGYREIDALGGYDPYSASKACCEIAVSSYRNSFFNIEDYADHHKAIASVRAGNVIGGGDWAEHRIVPDCIRAIEKNVPLVLRNPKAVRPWQHVLEPLYGYLELSRKMMENPLKYSGSYNFGPDFGSNRTVEEIAQEIYTQYDAAQEITFPKERQLHEARLLLLDITKARTVLRWNPILSVSEMISWTVEWYRHYRTQDVYDLCCRQISEYENIVGKRKDHS